MIIKKLLVQIIGKILHATLLQHVTLSINMYSLRHHVS